MATLETQYKNYLFTNPSEVLNFEDWKIALGNSIKEGFINMSKKQQHKQWRKNFNEVCLERDGHKCVFCTEDVNLDVHHITDRHIIPNGGYVLSNGITVCDKHHWVCEQYHMTGNCEPEYHPDELYKKINSSYDKAFEDSKNLK